MISTATVMQSYVSGLSTHFIKTSHRMCFQDEMPNLNYVHVPHKDNTRI